MYYKTCEACGHKSGRNKNEKRIFMAKFPLDELRCKQWVKVIGKSDLVYVPIEKLHMLRYVCGRHFKLTDLKKKKTQLKKTAIPSLLITREPLTDDILESFPLHIAKENVTESLVDSSTYPNTEHNYVKSSFSERKRLHNLEPSIPAAIEETEIETK